MEMPSSFRTHKIFGLEHENRYWTCCVHIIGTFISNIGHNDSSSHRVMMYADTDWCPQRLGKSNHLTPIQNGPLTRQKTKICPNYLLMNVISIIYKKCEKYHVDNWNTPDNAVRE